MQELDVIIKSIQSVPCKQVIFVSNELGSGIVPMDAMTRCYRDIMGCVNQRVAKEAAQVYFTVSGVTVEMKGLQVILPDVQEDTL
jgi:adenosylcobinamide kinase/adenosylcobinamide-phosphate guanylyltransferase